MSTCSEFNYTEASDPCTHVKVGKHFYKTLIYKYQGVAIDITGYVYEMTIKDTLGGSVILSMPMVGDLLTTGLYVDDPLTGWIYVQISEADTIAVGDGVYPYEMIQTDPSGRTSTYMQGTIQFVDRGY